MSYFKPKIDPKLTIEAGVLALKGLSPAHIAQTLNVTVSTVNDALVEAGGWFVTRHCRKGKRHKVWFFPEGDRKRLGIPWERCQRTGAYMYVWGHDKKTIVPDDPRVTAWESDPPL